VYTAQVSHWLYLLIGFTAWRVPLLFTNNTDTAQNTRTTEPIQVTNQQNLETKAKNKRPEIKNKTTELETKSKPFHTKMKTMLFETEIKNRP